MLKYYTFTLSLVFSAVFSTLIWPLKNSALLENLPKFLMEKFYKCMY